MNHLEAFEANLLGPLAKIRPRIVERIAEFDEHVQRHEQTENVFTPRVVNQGFYGDKRAALPGAWIAGGGRTPRGRLSTPRIESFLK